MTAHTWPTWEHWTLQWMNPVKHGLPAIYQTWVGLAKHSLLHLRVTVEISRWPFCLPWQCTPLNAWSVQAWFTREHKDKTKGKTKEWSQACNIRIVVIISIRSLSKYKPWAEQKTKRKILVLSLQVPEEISRFVFVLILSLWLSLVWTRLKLERFCKSWPAVV